VNSLPSGWATTYLSHVCKLLNGRAYKQPELLGEGKYPVLRVGNFFSNRHWYFSNLELEPEKYCDNGDLLYAWSASFGPKIWDGGKVIYHYHIWRTQPDEGAVAKKFLYYWFEWDKENIKAEHGTGSTMIHVTKGDMEARPLGLPPLAEQRRIIAKLDALAAGLARARAELKRADILQRRIRLSSLSQVFAKHLNSPNEKLECLCRIGTGSTPKRGDPRYYSGGTIAWVTSGAVNQRLVDKPTEFITDAAVKETNCRVFPAGSLLVALYGEGKTRGKVAKLGIAAATNQALAVLHSFEERVDPQWISLFLEARYQETRDQAAGGVQPNLNLGIIKAISLPVPPLNQQRAAIDKANLAFVRADRLEAEAVRARALLDRLETAILAKAFKGELVPQDPNDEPASVLLERIRAQRSAPTQAKHNPRTHHRITA
jgi:type I restriction enzyme S subunit